MTSRIDLKRGFLASFTAVAIALALVLVAGGLPASADNPDTWEASSEANNKVFWVTWGANTHIPGEGDWECTKDERGDEDGEDYVLEEEPPTDRFWRLLVVKTGSEVNDLHWDPELGQSFAHSKKPGWSHVILCSRPIPETDPGNIVVVKEVTEGSATDKSFLFKTDYSSDFSLKDGESNDSGDLTAGTYSVVETVPTGWTLQSATCDGDSTPADINLEEGETVTCTFVNHEIPDEIQPGKIIVKKEVTVGDMSKVFTFTESGFTLDDNTLAHGEMGMSGDVEPGGDYSVSESVPEGWTLQPATCDDANSTPADINVEAGETVTCTFVNIEDEVSQTTIVSTPTTIVSTTVEVSADTLPFTGFENGTSGLLALMLVASGALALVGTRVFRKETDE